MTIKTHQDIIALFPSIPVLARDCDFAYISVWKWNERNNIPPEWWCVIVHAAHERDLNITYKLLAETVRNRRFISESIKPIDA